MGDRGRGVDANDGADAVPGAPEVGPAPRADQVVTVDEDALLGALAAAVGAGDTAVSDELVIVRRGVRRRSIIYYVGVRATPGVSRWVVKCPATGVERLGIQPPAPAEDQFEALRRLHAFLAASGGRFASPRPVALLPEFSALAMEFAQGRSLWELVQPAALHRPQELLAGVREAALALRHLHSIEPPRAQLVDLRELENTVFEDSAAALRGAGLPVKDRWFTPGLRPSSAVTQVVLLHGDWAPENVLLAEDHVFLLDPELTDHGWAEHDLARFLLMLLDRSLFVATDTFGRSRRLRHEATSTFLTAYYGTAPVSPVLGPLLLRETARRWTVRHQDVVNGGRRLRRPRSRLLRGYFSRVLDEVSDPQWADSARNNGSPLP